MNKLFSKAFIFILIAVLSFQLSTADSSTYIGAVVEYNPVTVGNNAEDVLNKNVANYLRFIKTAAESKVDILVFPESSLTTSSRDQYGSTLKRMAFDIPDPEHHITPCNSENHESPIKSISCAAKDSKMYVVINLHEKVNSTNETYNTNVVFDRNGQVISRYRKYNLFNEAGISVPSEAVPTYFQTDFGVTFGHFICFDLLFQKPALNLTRNLNISNIIFPSHWFSELPFLFSVSAQAAWAYANNVNLLSAGYNEPATGSGGSGIYLGQGPHEIFLSDEKSNFIIISEIPKKLQSNLNSEIFRPTIISLDKAMVTASDIKEIKTKKFKYVKDNLQQYSTKVINFNETIFNEKLCNRNLCCHFDIETDQVVNQSTEQKYYRNRAAVFNGVRTFTGAATGGIQSCGIISCTNDSLNSCRDLFDNDNNTLKSRSFKAINITLIKVVTANKFFMPITLSVNMKPINNSNFKFEVLHDKETKFITMISKKKINNLITFAIYGRNFALDGSDATKSSSNLNYYNFPLIIFFNLLSLIFASNFFLRKLN